MPSRPRNWWRRRSPRRSPPACGSGTRASTVPGGSTGSGSTCSPGTSGPARWRRGLAGVSGCPNAPVSDDDYERIEELIDFERFGEALAEAMSTLPEEQREAVRLRAVDGRSYGEVAVELGCTEPTSCRSVSRGLRRIDEHQPDPGPPIGLARRRGDERYLNKAHGEQAGGARLPEGDARRDDRRSTGLVRPRPRPRAAGSIGLGRRTGASPIRPPRRGPPAGRSTGATGAAEPTSPRHRGARPGLRGRRQRVRTARGCPHDRTAELSVVIPRDAFDDRFGQAVDVAEEQGGFVADWRTRSRSGSLTVRVPAANFDETLRALRALDGRCRIGPRQGRHGGLCRHPRHLRIGGLVARSCSG